MTKQSTLKYGVDRMKPVHLGKYWGRFKKLIFVIGMIFLAISIYNIFPTRKEKNLFLASTMEFQRSVFINKLDSLNEQISRIESSENTRTESAVILKDSISALKRRASMYSDSLKSVEAGRQLLYKLWGVNHYFDRLDDIETTALGSWGKGSGAMGAFLGGEAASIKKTRRNNMVVYLLLGLMSFGLFVALAKYERKRK